MQCEARLPALAELKADIVAANQTSTRHCVNSIADTLASRVLSSLGQFAETRSPRDVRERPEGTTATANFTICTPRAPSSETRPVLENVVSVEHLPDAVSLMQENVELDSGSSYYSAGEDDSTASESGEWRPATDADLMDPDAEIRVGGVPIEELPGQLAFTDSGDPDNPQVSGLGSTFSTPTRT